MNKVKTFERGERNLSKRERRELERTEQLQDKVLDTLDEIQNKMWEKLRR